MIRKIVLKLQKTYKHVNKNHFFRLKSFKKFSIKVCACLRVYLRVRVFCVSLGTNYKPIYKSIYLKQQVFH